MKKSIIKIFLPAILICCIVASCSDFLNKHPYSYTSKGFYNTEEGLRDGVTGIYPLLYINLNWSVPFPIVLDAYTPLGLENAQNTTISAGGGLNPSNGTVSTWWSGLYSLIARANSVIYGASPTIGTMSDIAKQYYSEARVLRAYAYYNLISTYGDVPFFTAPVTVDEYQSKKTSKVEILDFIIAEMEDAAQYMPWTAANRGRVDKAVAYGLEARAALLGGSLNYGGNGQKYFRTAADAASKVIGKRHLASRYSDLFNLKGQAKSEVRDEMLWELMYSNQGTRKWHWSSYGQSSRNYGSSVRYPSLMLANTYECTDGKRIDESTLYDPRHPSKNRDPRFSVTLKTEGDTVEYYTTSGVNKMIVEAYEPTTMFYSGSAGKWYEGTNKDVVGTTSGASFINAGAGYLWYKYGDEVSEALSSQTCDIALMRYAEVLLTYAEAKIELNELDQSVYDAINAVRNRAGMPSVSEDRKGNQNKMRQLVRRERKVELIMEGIHFIDMKRWQIGDIENDSPSYGAPLSSIRYEGLSPKDIPDFKTDERHDLNDIPSFDSFKSKLKVRDINRYWDQAFSLWPIPQSAIDKDPNLEQNEGYK
ncbi:MAG: RagB/SusD family nutrient uptake outer membrane protein [Bacteroidales bacterium]|nr:RagB/SusD family nutrient uptake outer membrane protein [Bacteroidales bacterium]